MGFVRNLATYSIVLVLAASDMLLSDPPLMAGPDAMQGSSSNQFDCETIEARDIDTTLPIPILDPLPQYSNAKWIILRWQCEKDKSRVFRYYVEASYHDIFRPTIFACDLVDSEQYHDSIYVCRQQYHDSICVCPQIPVWFRVRCVTKDYRYGRPSDSVFTIVDTIPPLLDSIRLSDVSKEDSALIRVAYYGYDSGLAGCASLLVWEPDEDNLAISSIPDCQGRRDYSPVTNGEWANIFVCLVDAAGNRSNTLDSTVRIIPPVPIKISAHCYPNPFNPAKGEKTNLVFSLLSERTVSIRIYDAFGNLVKDWEVVCHAGENRGSDNALLQWDGRKGLDPIVGIGGFICAIKYGDGKPDIVRIAVRK